MCLFGIITCLISTDLNQVGGKFERAQQAPLVSRPQSVVPSDSENFSQVASSWKLTDLQYVTVLPLSTELYSACQNLKHHTLDSNGLPKPWAFPIITQGSGTAFRSFDTVTSRFDVTFNAQFKRTPHEVLDSLSLLPNELKRLLVCAGLLPHSAIFI